MALVEVAEENLRDTADSALWSKTFTSRVNAATLIFGREKQSHLRHRFYDLAKGGSAPIATEVLVYKTDAERGCP